MLDARSNHMVTRSNQPCNSEVVALGSTASENHLGSIAPEQLRDGLARTLNRRPRILSMVMDGRGIAKTLAKPGAHSLKHLGQDRRGGVVVEVNAVHTEPASILRELR